MEGLRGYDDMVECPYNKAHQILRSRFQTHLVRCRRSHPDVVLETCHFNSTHLMRKSELIAHMTDCPDRSQFDRFRYQFHKEKTEKKKAEEGPAEGAPAEEAPAEEAPTEGAPPTNDKAMAPTTPQPIPQSGTSAVPADKPKSSDDSGDLVVVPSEESWDDVDVPSYNPQAYAESAPVLRTLNCATPSERRAFREAERKRIIHIQTGK